MKLMNASVYSVFSDGTRESYLFIEIATVAIPIEPSKKQFRMAGFARIVDRLAQHVKRNVEWATEMAIAIIAGNRVPSTKTLQIPAINERPAHPPNRTPGTRLSNPTRKAAMAAFLFRSDSQVLAFGQLSSGFQLLARTSAITRNPRVKPERQKQPIACSAHGFDRPRFLARCTLRQARVVLANVFRFRPDRSSRPQTI